MDKFRVDDQKIFYFPDRIAQWMEAGNKWEKLKKVYPIYMEVSPSASCNHRCIFCALDYLGFKKKFLDFGAYLRFVKAASRKGVKSIMFGGEGEPLMHPRIGEMITETKGHGIDVAFTTNGSLMTPGFLDANMSDISWFKISLDAASAETHVKIHRTNKKDFHKIISNIKYAVALKKKKKYNCSIGVQLLLLKQNYKEVLCLAETVKKIGIDYFVVKPYSQGLYSRNKLKIDYKKFKYLENQINKLSNRKFSSVFRGQAFETAIAKGTDYKYCHSVPFFWAYIMANGDVHTCSAFLGNKKFIAGNIKHQDFDVIWEGKKRMLNWKMLKKMSINSCRRNCRMDKVNNYLDKILNPVPNHTFI
ncbi:MAG: radical SAM protein [Elusimicrobia bacterium HGW-Elusimicrobia-2]|nr:MAG: radical SAM protein [Elusimicrobia bacterium HGW-Elusimicrobia-2]